MCILNTLTNTKANTGRNSRTAVRNHQRAKPRHYTEVVRYKADRRPRPADERGFQAVWNPLRQPLGSHHPLVSAPPHGAPGWGWDRAASSRGAEGRSLLQADREGGAGTGLLSASGLPPSPPPGSPDGSPHNASSSSDPPAPKPNCGAPWCLADKSEVLVRPSGLAHVEAQPPSSPSRSALLNAPPRPADARGTVGPAPDCAPEPRCAGASPCHVLLPPAWVPQLFLHPSPKPPPRTAFGHPALRVFSRAKQGWGPRGTEPGPCRECAGPAEGRRPRGQTTETG